MIHPLLHRQTFHLYTVYDTESSQNQRLTTFQIYQVGAFSQKMEGRVIVAALLLYNIIEKLFK